jgi:hypothetical protein
VAPRWLRSHEPPASGSGSLESEMNHRFPGIPQFDQGIDSNFEVFTQLPRRDRLVTAAGLTPCGVMGLSETSRRAPFRM